MGPSRKFQGVFIELDNPSRSYFAGQVIQGRVVINNSKQLKVKEVTILLDGTGRTRWTETHTRTVPDHHHNHTHHHHHQAQGHGRRENRPGATRTETYTVTYSSEEKYVMQRIPLAGDGNTFIVLDTGTIVYPFRFVLPTNLPSSFTSRIGIVSYFLEVELKRPILKANIRSSLPFTVNGIFDLNLEPAAANPQETKGYKGSNFCACRKGQMGFALQLPRRSGFVPGEILDFSAEVSNNSNKQVAGLKGSLRQVCTFHAQGQTKTESRYICEVKGPEVDKGDHEMWAPQPGLRIPPLPPTRLGGICRLIDVQYFLEFQMKVSGLSMSLTGELPVMIGTIPFRNTFEQFRPPGFVMPPITPPIQGGSGMGFQARVEPVPGPSHKLPAPQPPPPQPSAPSEFVLPNYPDLPPPTYAEAVGTENFNWDTPNSNKDEKRKIDEDEEENNLGASAPPMSEYVPSYVTYYKA